MASRQHGYSLVEILVYLAIFLASSTAAVTLLISLDELIDQYRIETALYRSSTNVLEHVITELRRAELVNAADTTLNDAALGQLSVSSDGTITQFVKNGDDLELIIDAVNQGSLLDDRVTVDGFTVFQYDTTAGTLIRVQLAVTGTQDTVTKSLTVYGGALIRGTP